MNIDLLMEIIKTRKALDVKAVMEQDVPAYAKVFNVKNGMVEYLDLRKDTIYALRAAVSAIPYFWCGEQEHVDGGIADMVGLEHLLRRHPDSKMVLVVNHTLGLGFRHSVKNCLEGLAAAMMYKNLPMLRIFLGKKGVFMRDIAVAKEYDNLLVVSPPKNNPTRPNTIDPKKLRATYELGKREAEKILKFIE
jgi:predicted patatin/cPLA2 family phospholipase